MEQLTPHQPSRLRQHVLGRIDSEQICPRSRLFFHSRECFVWTMWLCSVIVGALAVAVMLYVAVYLQFALFEVSHTNRLLFALTILPYLWLATFIIMGYLAVREFRRTKRGYRYQTTRVLGSSILVSILGGLALHGAGIGAALDTSFGSFMGTYPSLEKAEMVRWQQPAEGRLVGVVVYHEEVPLPWQLIDVHATSWGLVTSDLPPEDLALLVPDAYVRLMGMPLTDNRFQVCMVLPWLSYGEMRTEYIAQERRLFEARARSLVGAQEIDQATIGQDAPAKRCADMVVIERLRMKWQD